MIDDNEMSHSTFTVPLKLADPDIRAKGRELHQSTQEATYREGINTAEHLLAAECRDYNRVLGGLASVLAAEGVVATPQELSGLFHDPLATWPVRVPFECLADALSITAAPGPPSYYEERVLHRRMEVYLPYVSESDLVDEASLNGHLANLDTRRKELDRDLSTRIAPLVATYRARAEIVEALLGPADSVMKALARAGDLEHAAATMRARMDAEISRVEQRIVALPTERANSIQPLAALKPKVSSFEGNTAPHDSPYLCDHCMVVHKLAVRRKGQGDKLAARVPPVYRGGATARQSTAAVAAVFERAVAAVNGADALDMLGWFPCASKIGRSVVARNIAIGVDHAGDLVYFDADKLRWVQSLTGFDEVRARLSWAGFKPRRYAAHNAAVLLRQGVEVAVLMPLREDSNSLPFDVEVARRTIGQRKESDS